LLLSSRHRGGEMERADIEQIARLVLRDYGLPLKLRTVSVERTGECTVGFADSYSGSTTVSVGIWCDSKASPYAVRESLKKALEVTG
jgi:hypothetical protein